MKIASALLAIIVVAFIFTGTADARNHSYGTSRSYTTHYSYTSGHSAYYTNVSGHKVHCPVFSTHAPTGWSAQCADHSYSFSEHRRGTCSHHGGVLRWH